MWQRIKEFLTDANKKHKVDLDMTPSPAKEIDQFYYIDKILKNLTADRTLLTITFHDSSETYSSILLSVDKEKNHIILDEISPAEGHFLAINNVPFTISTREHGVFLSFQSKVLRHVDEDNLSYYYLPYPQDVNYTQRRKAYRVPLDKNNGLRADIFLPNHPRISAEVIDISVSGLRLMVKHNITGVIDSKRFIDQCLLIPQEMKPTPFSLEIKSSFYDMAQKSTLLCCQFVDINANDQLYLIELVGKLQQHKIQKRFG